MSVLSVPVECGGECVERYRGSIISIYMWVNRLRNALYHVTIKTRGKRVTDFSLSMPSAAILLPFLWHESYYRWRMP